MTAAGLRLIVWASVVLALLIGSGGTARAVERADLVTEPAGEWAPLASRQPVYDPEQGSGAEIGAIRIPAIGVDEVVRAGVAIEVIDQGPAHWVGTADPGTAGNVVIAGHRSVQSAPFRALDRLVEGDLVIVTNSYGFDVMYRVTETFIVTPDAIWITYDDGHPLLTLFACHPVGSAAQRIVVRAELVGGRLLA